MKIVQAIHEAHVGAMLFRSDVPYVCSDNAAAGIVSAAPRLIRVVADAAPYIRHWRAQDLTGKRLLIYRCLGMGDEFMAARFAAVAKDRWPTAQIALAIFDAHHSLWSASDLPFTLSGAYIPLPVWQSADFHVAGEHWWENNAMADQPSAWQMMQDATGLTLQPDEQVPYIPTPSATCLQSVRDFLADWLPSSPVGRACLPGAPIILWQLAATSNIRSYPPERTEAALRLLLAQSNANIILAGHPMQIAAYTIPESPRIRVYSAGIEGLIAICHLLSELPTANCQLPTDSLPTANCQPPTAHSCIVCPDSVLGHIAAAYPEIPVISLWSSFSPADRIASYTNHKPIYNAIKCSPCRAHEQTGNPKDYRGCPHTSCNDYCAGLRTIAPARIASVVATALCAVPSVATALCAVPSVATALCAVPSEAPQ
jgi:ADP-heptose:LPS heptosyltransferase